MPFSLTNARFRLQRAIGLVERGLSSLGTRGWNATWQRVRHRIASPPRFAGLSLTGPDMTAFAPFSLPVVAAEDTPQASLIIPVHGQSALTIACLRALAADPPSAGFEVLVVDDASTDDSPELLPRIDGLRYLRRDTNAGFVASCNDGARAARGQYLVFLNNDTVPQRGWLDGLLATFAQHPQAGLVGAQLIYPDGRLQEAGGLVFNDGSGWNYGRFESPADPRYGYLRDTDYVSGAALAVPKALFDAVGGFDARYSPAYYEDTDLAFAVRAAGKRVIYQPAAKVVHLEGATAGTDLHQGMKAHQLRNRAVFAEHRRDALVRQPLPTATPGPQLLHRHQRTVLIVDESIPRPDRDSASLRMLNLIRTLIEEGIHVVFVPDDRRHAGHYTDALQAMGVEVWYAPFLGALPHWIKANGARLDTVMLCRHRVARRLLPLLRRHAPQARLIFDSVDLHYLREARAARVHADGRMSRLAARTRKLELDVVGRSDVTLVVSHAERKLLARDMPDADVRILSNLHRVAGSGQSFEQRSDLVFVGGFHHPPNTDAVQWLIREIWPLIRERLPGIRLHCIGSDPPADIRALAGEDILVHGHVPDITPWMEGCRIGLAPLRYGAGVKGKVNLSMAHGQPMVATVRAVEGMHLTDGRDVLVASDAGGFAEAVVRLYEDEALWRRLSSNGLDNVARHFSIDAARQTIRELFVGPADPDFERQR